MNHRGLFRAVSRAIEVDGRALPSLSLVAFFIGLILALNEHGCRELVRAESANRLRLVRYFLGTTSNIASKTQVAM